MPLLFPTFAFSLQGFDFWIGLFLYFSVFCVLGWVTEMAYLATSGRGLINSGFLQGPVCPAYAAGACIIYPCIVAFSGFPIWLQFIAFAILATIIEFVAHFSLEKILGIRIWDYSDEFMNLQGRISLKYSFFWFLLVALFAVVLHPVVIMFIEWLPANARNGIAIFFAVTLPLDYLYSGLLYNRLMAKINQICAALDLPAKEMKELEFNRPRIMNEKKRLAKLFKDETYAALAARVEKALFEGDDFTAFGFERAEYVDIVDHPKYREWRESTEKRKAIFARYMRIAELSWKFCSILGLDAKSAARGILLAAYQSEPVGLHRKTIDFFFPQTRIWRAVTKDLCKLNKVERDVVLCYKWPLNFTAPLTIECLAVSFAEKLVQSREFRRELGKLYGKAIA